MDEYKQVKATLEAMGLVDKLKKNKAVEGFVVRAELHLAAGRPPLIAYATGGAFVLDMAYAEVYPTEKAAEEVRAAIVANSKEADRLRPGAGYANAESTSVVPFIPAPYGST